MVKLEVMIEESRERTRAEEVREGAGAGLWDLRVLILIF